jgi:hypothetical protein
MPCTQRIEWSKCPESERAMTLRADGAAIALSRLKRALELDGADDRTLDIVTSHIRAAESMR